jgi:hypothetical protein
MNIHVLPLELKYIICSNLSYIDILSLKYTCRENPQILLPSFKNIFINRSLQHNIVQSYNDAILFCDNLYDTGAYVAGSFILDCLYNTNYHGDIDVYDQGQCDCFNNSLFRGGIEDDNLKFTQRLYQANFKSLGLNDGNYINIRSFINLDYPDLPIDLFDNEDDYENRYEFKEKCRDLIQVIPILLKLKNGERSTIPRFISSTFDLDICKSNFDGEQLYIKNINKLIYRYDYIKPNTLCLLIDYHTDNQYDISELTNIRMKKYISRGFDIKLHPDYDKIVEHVTNEINLDNITNDVYYRFELIDDECINLDLYNDY